MKRRLTALILTLALLAAVCRHNGARDLQRAGLPPAEYRPEPEA